METSEIVPRLARAVNRHGQMMGRLATCGDSICNGDVIITCGGGGDKHVGGVSAITHQPASDAAGRGEPLSQPGSNQLYISPLLPDQNSKVRCF